MIAEQTTQLPAWSDTMKELLAKVSSETFNIALLVMAVVGFVVLGKINDLINGMWWILFSLGLYGLIAGLWLLKRWNYPLAAWGLVAGTLAGILLLGAVSKVAFIIFLVILPVGLAMLVISRSAGIIVAGLATCIVVFFPANILPLDSMLRIISL